ncbi:hypothetical protein [Amycolatopsis acididurans]|uniref:hypothetical protein n=1 Tax=Amycolatopsis acididurans TaxID=2724524 RepID=UPI001B323638|nr:hypothetical protein [Amycolatopsis acididurans]
MTSGFGAVPDDLRQTAGKIGDVISGVADLVWRGPGGDYGHAGVQQGWAQFIEDMRDRVQKLHATAGEHGENLTKAALAYVESDEKIGTELSHIGDVIGDLGGGLGGIVPSVAVGTGDDGGMVGGGWTGPLKNAGIDLGAGSGEDGGMVGGGWTGPLKEAGVDLGAGADAHSGIMSPERSRELFPQVGDVGSGLPKSGDIGSRLNPGDEGPVY